ncbi:hypothetical protein [Devosia sp.]|uniref:hypothetical protein n=1 Tax=Devosia sp. TaxID=1871048 RepID=UPI003F70AACB
MGRVTNSGVFTETIRYNGFTLGRTGPSMFSFVSAGEGLAFDVPGVGLVIQSLHRNGSLIAQVCGVPEAKIGSRLDAVLFLRAVEQAFRSSCQLDFAVNQRVVVFEEIGPPAKATAYDSESLPEGLKIVSIVVEPTSEDPGYGRLSPLLWASLSKGQMQRVPLLPGARLIGLSESTFVVPVSADRVSSDRQ